MTEDFDLVFRNDIIGVKPTLYGEYLSIGFDTNITVNQYIVRKLYRRMTGTVSSGGDFCVCFAAQMVPDVLDSLGKGGYFDGQLDPMFWGYEDNSIRHLFELIPSLKQRYSETDTFAIECQSSRFSTTNDINKNRSSYPILEFQDPKHCFMIIDSSGEYALSVDVHLRLHYSMGANSTAFIGQTKGVSVYGFSTYPDLPESKKEILSYNVHEYAKIFEDGELFGPGIQVIPTRNSSLHLASFEEKSEEICFYYDENDMV